MELSTDQKTIIINLLNQVSVPVNQSGIVIQIINILQSQLKPVVKAQEVNK